MSEGDSFCAEVEAGGVHIRLFSEHTAAGVKVSVFDVDSREWIARFEPASDIEQGKTKAPLPWDRVFWLATVGMLGRLR